MSGLTKNEKISKSLRERNSIKSKPNLVCGQCKVEYYRKPSRANESKFCSNSCKTTWQNLNTDIASKAGRSSVISQKESRRSKNEILFYELCKNKFQNVLCNEPIFNGWDADVILVDEKIAILWNGKWHYEKITEKHSVEQVQNRDRLKIKEIESLGFTPYIVKDMGKFNVSFVNKEFENFLKFIAG